MEAPGGDSLQYLTELHAALKNIQSLSGKILSKGVQLLKDIASEESEIIEEISDQLDHSSDSEIAEEAQNYLNSLITDSETIHQEIEEFARAVVRGNEAVYKIDSLFFQQVWHGDMYDKDHVDGLKALCADLQGQLGLLTDDNVVNTVVSRLREVNNDSSGEES